MTELYTEEFDGVTAPALPSGLTLSGLWATDSTEHKTGTNSLKMTSRGSVETWVPTGIVSTTPDKVQGAIWFKHNHNAGIGGVLSRLDLILQNADQSVYEQVFIRLYAAEDDRIYVQSSGGGDLAMLTASALIQANVWHLLILTHDVGTGNLTALMARFSDGKYLTSGSSWSSTPGNFYDADADVTGVDRVTGDCYIDSGDGQIYIDSIDVQGDAVVVADSYTLTGPNSVKEGTESADFTVAGNGITTDTVTPALDEAGETFTPSTVDLDDTNDVTFTVTPGVTGTRRTKHVSTTNDGGLTDPASVAIEIWVQQAVTVSPSGPISLANSGTQQFSKSVTGGPTGESAAGTWSVHSGSGSVDSTGLYTAPSSGSGSAVIRFTHTASGVYDEQTANYAPAAATALTKSGPGTATTGVDFNVTVALSPSGGITTGNVTVTPHGTNGATFTPSTRILSTGSQSATFAVNEPVAGDDSITFTNDGGLTNPSALAVTVSDRPANPLRLSRFGTPGHSGYGATILNSSGQVWDGSAFVDIADTLDTYALAYTEVGAAPGLFQLDLPDEIADDLYDRLDYDGSTYEGGSVLDLRAFSKGSSGLTTAQRAIFQGDTVKISAGVYEFQIAGVSIVRVTIDPTTKERTMEVL